MELLDGSVVTTSFSFLFDEATGSIDVSLLSVTPDSDFSEADCCCSDDEW